MKIASCSYYEQRLDLLRQLRRQYPDVRSQIIMPTESLGHRPIPGHGSLLIFRDLSLQEFCTFRDRFPDPFRDVSQRAVLTGTALDLITVPDKENVEFSESDQERRWFPVILRAWIIADLPAKVQDKIRLHCRINDAELIQALRPQRGLLPTKGGPWEYYRRQEPRMWERLRNFKCQILGVEP